MQNLIKVLRFNLFHGSLIDRKQFVGALGGAFKETGFILLKNHGISPELLTETREGYKKFYNLPLKKRMDYVYPDDHYQKGYTPVSIEKGEFANVADYKHFYQFGDSYENPIIKEIPGLTELSNELFGQFYGLYRDLMQAVALSLDLPAHFFYQELGNSIMRVIHYPAHGKPMADDGEVARGGNIQGMCASKHTDINDLTLLHATEPGLQLWYKGKWIPVWCNASMIIVNVGDMLWHLTGGLYKSGVHRVVCEPGVERMSSPFFGHRIDKASIVPLSHLGEYDKQKFRFKNEGEFLTHRLKQINLQK